MDNIKKKIGKNVALAVLSQIPIASAFGKFFEDFVQECWQERIDLWKEEIIKRLSQLDAEIENKIKETSNFASILASAQRGALEDIEDDKVALYANVVINAINNENIDNAKKHIFLNMLRDFASLHIKVLRDISKSKGPQVTLRADGFHAKNPLFHELYTKYKDKELLEAIIKSLAENHLTYIVADKIGRAEPTIITDLGKEFLRFISEQEISDACK